LVALQSESTRKRMGMASRERVEALFSEGRMIEQFERQIQALVRRQETHPAATRLTPPASGD
jgi:hypothetical protein